MRTFTAILQKEEDMYVAHCPEIRTVSQGRTIKSALANLKQATELYLETQPRKKHFFECFYWNTEKTQNTNQVAPVQ